MKLFLSLLNIITINLSLNKVNCGVLDYGKSLFKNLVEKVEKINRTAIKDKLKSGYDYASDKIIHTVNKINKTSVISNINSGLKYMRNLTKDITGSVGKFFNEEEINEQKIVELLKLGEIELEINRQKLNAIKLILVIIVIIVSAYLFKKYIEYKKALLEYDIESMKNMKRKY